MRWTRGESTEDIEDRRGESGGRGGFRGGGMRLGLGGTLLLLVLSFIFKTDLLSLFSGGGSVGMIPETASAPPIDDPAEEERKQFIAFVLNDAQRTWDKLLPQNGGQYRHATLVLFRDLTQSACGAAQSATGPFYCPGDEKVYLDLSFFDELRTRFGAAGEFAQAYVVAHEIGHHVQKVIGIESRVRQLQRRNPGAENQLSVRMELQADCLAGVWGNATAERKLLDQRDIESGLRAAAAVGDDHIQKMSGRGVSPESFTHGSSAQRMQWFKRGLQSGDVGSCNTFGQ
jgi:hypothetical protein